VKLRVLQQAEWEARDAAVWYEDRVQGLGAAFIDQLEHGLERIEEDPKRFGRLETFVGSRDIRRLLLRRFPYLVAYEIIADEVMVLAVAHVSRCPSYWIDRNE